MATGMTVAVPAVQADITPAWLTAALREGGRLREASVVALDIKEIGVGRGYLCLTLRLTPTYDRVEPGAPATVVAKVPTFLEWPDEAVAQLVADLCAAEVYWYRTWRRGVQCEWRSATGGASTRPRGVPASCSKTWVTCA